MLIWLLGKVKKSSEYEAGGTGVASLPRRRVACWPAWACSWSRWP